MKKLCLLLLTFFCLEVGPVFAGHVLGGEITYKMISNKKFEVTLKVYRDCRGIPMGNPANFKIMCSSTGVSRTFTYSKVSIRDITPVCDTATTQVCPTNSTSSSEGIEEHSYTGTIDFNSGSLATDLANGCCEFVIYMDECCRSGAGNFFITSMINVCRAPANNSPQMSNIPVHNLCCNRPFYYNMGAIDTLDGDSLAYALVPAKESSTTNYAYGTGFSYSKPLTPYLPGSPSQILPTANPPIGFYLDPANGDLIFTPTGCSEVAPVCIAVSEYRKDSTGTYRKIGEVIRDLQFIVRSCSPSNNPPTITGSSGFNYSVCEGNQLCFNIILRDQQFIPAPPASAAAPDSIKASWNQGIPGSTLTFDSFTSITGSTSKISQRNGRFCWTVPVGSYRATPYTFTVTANDKLCATPNISIRAFSVKVKKLASAARKYEVNSCGKLKVSATASTDSFSSVLWTIKDSTYQTVSVFQVDKAVSTATRDSFQFKVPGKYYMVVWVNNYPHNCSNYYVDTITIPQAFSAQIDSADMDTVMVCDGDSLVIHASPIGGKGPFRYKWLPVSTANDSSASFTFKGKGPVTMVVTITDSNGCSSSAQVHIKTSGEFSLGADRSACKGDSVTINGPPGMTSYLWLPDSSTSGDITVSNTGNYVLQTVNGFGCVFRDTVRFDTLHRGDFHLGDDRKICRGDTATLLGPPGMFSYLWLPGNITGQNLSVIKPGQYILRTMNNSNCVFSDTIVIDTLPLPKKSFYGLDTTICKGDTIRVHAQGGYSSYQWSTGQNSSFADLFAQGNVSVVITDSNGCKVTDNLSVSLDSMPPFSFSSTSLSGKSFSFTPSVNNPAWYYLWSFGDADTSTNQNPLHNYLLAGTYKVCLYISTIHGCLDSFCSNVTAVGLKDFASSIPLRVYPNPFNDHIELSLNLPVHSTVSFMLYDLPGKKLFSLEPEVAKQGEFTKQIDLAPLNLENGVYLFRVRVNETDIYVRLIRSE